MSRLSIPQDCETDRVTYANASAVSSGDVINVAGLGVLIAAGSYAAGVAGIYYKRGIFQFVIGSGVTVAQGDRCYFSVSAGAVIKTGMVAADFYLGRAIAAGTATAGYVNIQVGANAADYRTDGGLTAERIAAIIGQKTVAGTALLETVTDARFATTDYVIANFESCAADTTTRITKITKNTGSIVFNFSTVCTGSLLNYVAMKS